MDEKEFIENFGMTREEYAEKYGVLEDPNLGKDKTMRAIETYEAFFINGADLDTYCIKGIL